VDIRTDWPAKQPSPKKSPDHRQFHPAFLNVKNRFGRVALRKDHMLPWMTGEGPPGVELREERIE
jgi:hypothetical protein